MRKRILATTQENVRSQTQSGIDLERAAVVELTSEDKDYPIESVFGSGEGPGWRAATSGIQTIRLVFDQAQRVKCISLVFEEDQSPRTQEFVLRWAPETGKAFREIVRQQWNFSPPSAQREIEDYQVGLENVGALELTIVPNIGGGNARASLKSLRLS